LFAARESRERERDLRTAFTKAQDFLAALLRPDCDGAMTAIRLDDIAMPISEPTV
jgi:hypothetical protein